MKHKIFIGTVEIAGYFRGLADALRTKGADVTFITYSRHPFGYGGENPSYLADIVKWLAKRSARTPPSQLFLKASWTLLREIAALPFFLIMALKHDVFIFGFGESFLRRNVDLPILRFLGKKVIFNMFCGSELRPPYMDGSYQSKDGRQQASPMTLKKISRRHLKRIRWIERHADLIIGAPYTSQFSAIRIINYGAIGMPYKLEVGIDAEDRIDQTIRILHSPSHPASKGTERVRQAINSLCKKGYRIQLVELQGRTNQEVLHALSQCDFVIDQVFSDWPMAGFAAEAAWFGKPAVVGGYGLQELRKYVPDGMYPPSHTCHPDELESAVERLVADPDYRKSLGESARDFVQSQWTPEKVARRYLQLIDGDIPDAWWLDPNKVTYLHGCGQPEDRTKENIRKLVETYGISSLQLSHRPDLEKAFLEFAGIKLA